MENVISEIYKSKYYDATEYNTICNKKHLRAKLKILNKTKPHNNTVCVYDEIRDRSLFMPPVGTEVKYVG